MQGGWEGVGEIKMRRKHAGCVTGLSRLAAVLGLHQVHRALGLRSCVLCSGKRTLHSAAIGVALDSEGGTPSALSRIALPAQRRSRSPRPAPRPTPSRACDRVKIERVNRKLFGAGGSLTGVDAAWTGGAALPSFGGKRGKRPILAVVWGRGKARDLV